MAHDRQRVLIFKLALAGLFCALAVAGSFVSFPVVGSKCAPVQHMVNVLSAIFLGPWYGVIIALSASVLRNVLALGTVLAFPGSLVGAFCCGLVYARTRSLWGTVAAEMVGTGLIGGLIAYPLALWLLGTASTAPFYVYVVPFCLSTAVGALVAGLLTRALLNVPDVAALKRRLNPTTF